MVALSVLLPVRDGEATLDAAISSIRQQSFRDFELLVLDDGSRDASPDIATRHAAEDPRVRLLANPASGIVAALNFGIESAQAPLVARMDADDVALPERFERQLARLAAEPELLVLGTATIRIDAQGRRLSVATPPVDPPELARVLERVNAIAHPTVVMRKAALQAVGGYRRAYLRAEDYDLWLRLAERGKLSNLAEPLLEYRIGGPFRPQAFARQVLSEMAARAAARLRRNGGTDPTGAWDDIDAHGLAALGIGKEAVAAEIARRALQMTRQFRKLGDGAGFRAALQLADAQPRQGIAGMAGYALRRLKARL
jgi:glycosyltransferase involved in cell wall biosynthesis